MKILQIWICILAAGLILPTSASADWNPGDDHKMHFPQLPDPTGWDVAWGEWSLADDWQCSGTGEVSDVHFWISFQGWNQPELPPAFAPGQIGINIWSNQPEFQGEHSRPLNLLWSMQEAAINVRHYDTGQQGWFNPATGEFLEDDHTEYFQVNIMDIVDPFVQQEGEIYWLEVVMSDVDPTNPVGWKTADLTRYPPGHEGQHFMDDGVWNDQGSWEELRDPLTSHSLDLAFVITPEPGTGLLLLLTGLGMLCRRIRRR